MKCQVWVWIYDITELQRGFTLEDHASFVVRSTDYYAVTFNHIPTYACIYILRLQTHYDSFYTLVHRFAKKHVRKQHFTFWYGCGGWCLEANSIVGLWFNCINPKLTGLEVRMFCPSSTPRFEPLSWAWVFISDWITDWLWILNLIGTSIYSLLDVMYADPSGRVV